jgi:hypothetical protein
MIRTSPVRSRRLGGAVQIEGVALGRECALRQQVIVLHRKGRGRVRLTNGDRWFSIQLYRLFPSILQALHIVRPETLVRWHRTGIQH